MISKTIDIWKEQEYTGIAQAPYINTYILDGSINRPCILILPGGGYKITSQRESEAVALKFAQAGFHSVVLHYSVAPNKHPQPLYDVSQAMIYIRKMCRKWHIKKDSIIVCGFSAGGHLAASLGVHWNKQYLKNALNISNEENRPNGLILCYPVITSGAMAHKGSFANLLGDHPSSNLLDEMSVEKWVGKHTPPCFIWHTFQDKAVPIGNSLLFADALLKYNIPFDLHVFQRGVHGLSLANKLTADKLEHIDKHASVWIDLCISWLRMNFNSRIANC